MDRTAGDRQGTGGGSATAANGKSSLALLLVFSFLSSLGTGIVTNGISFLTKQAYGFTAVDNFSLAVVLGVTYIAGAWFAGPLTTKVRLRTGWSMRTLLAWIVGLMGLLCFIPWLASAAGVSGSWPVWILILCYSPLSGVLWPIVESYQSGGRTQADLRRAIGLFNVVWCSAIVVAMWTMGPFVERAPLRVIMVLGCLHVATIALVLRLGLNPATHQDELHPHPEIYERLLSALRILLPASYVVASALGPYLPDAMERIGVPTSWAAPLAATWQLTRLATFFLLGRWVGWHGRWFLPIAGTALMLVGFGTAVLSPRLMDPAMAAQARTLATPDLASIPLLTMLAGLASFGIGMASIYTAALYYAMEVGQTDSGEAGVESGGMHETLIGVGYTVGPLCGLIPTAMVQRGALGSEWMEATILCSVGGVGLIASAGAAWRARSGASDTVGESSRVPKPPPD